MSIIGIVAVDRQGAIGKEGRLPWHYSADMKFFKQTTVGHACVMGYRTWLALKKPLPDRVNIVLSRQAEVSVPDSVLVMHDVESVLSFYESLNSDLFVIGGAKIYRSFLSHIDKWHVTEVPLIVEGADTFMPDNYLRGFRRMHSQQLDGELTVAFYERAGDLTN